MQRVVGLVLFLTMGALLNFTIAACRGDGDADGDADTDGDADGDSDGDSDGDCADNETRCGEDCVDLQTDSANCGACGNACSVYSGFDASSGAPTVPAGECEVGACTPTLGECIAHDEYPSCDDYCASIGEECVESVCHRLVFAEFDSMANCESGQERIGWSGACDRELLPNIAGSGGFYRCCCTQ